LAQALSVTPLASLARSIQPSFRNRSTYD
jgi:hypothetical protein